MGVKIASSARSVLSGGKSVATISIYVWRMGTTKTDDNLVLSTVSIAMMDAILTFILRYVFLWKLSVGTKMEPNGAF